MSDKITRRDALAKIFISAGAVTTLGYYWPKKEHYQAEMQFRQSHSDTPEDERAFCIQQLQEYGHPSPEFEGKSNQELRKMLSAHWQEEDKRGLVTGGAAADALLATALYHLTRIPE